MEVLDAADLRRQVKAHIHAIESVRGLRPLPKVGADEFDGGVRSEVRVSLRQVIDHTHFVPVLQQLPHDGASDKAGPSGHQNHRPFPLQKVISSTPALFAVSLSHAPQQSTRIGGVCMRLSPSRKSSFRYWAWFVASTIASAFCIAVVSSRVSKYGSHTVTSAPSV